MPELPEVETVVRGLGPVLTGHRIVRAVLNRPDLRFPLPDGMGQRLTGATVTGVTRRAKYILITLADGWIWLVHLGMSGRFTLHPAGSAPAPRRATSAQAGRTDGVDLDDAHDHVVVTLDDDTVLRFNDARRFGFMDLIAPGGAAEHPRLVDLGPEPLDPGFDGAGLATALAGRRTPIKAALLDQHVVAGLGNIYVCEALFHARLAPTRLAHTVGAKPADRLVRAIKSVLTAAIAAGGSSLRDYVQASGELGYFQHTFAVYGREGEPCPGCRCGEGIARIVQSGRSTFWCATRQR